MKNFAWPIKWHRLALRLALFAGMFGQVALTPAETLEASSPALYAQAQAWLNAQLTQLAAELPLRVELSVGKLDARLRLAACEEIEPYLPPGSQLWGKTRLALRCVKGASRWNVFLPITVRAFGPAWVVKAPLAAGTVLSASDAMQAQVDWAQESSPVVAKLTDWVGQTSTRALSSGVVLRRNLLKATQVFQAGTQVRVLVQGTGFTITSSGQAVGAGVIGQSVRVRMDNGHLLSGLVQDDRTVSLTL